MKYIEIKKIQVMKFADVTFLKKISGSPVSNVFLVIILLTALTACNYETVRSDKKLPVSDEVSEFIIKCANAANPMSDEEGEDLIYQCEKTAREIYGTSLYYVAIGRDRYCESPDVAKTRECWNKNKSIIYGQ